MAMLARGQKKDPTLASMAGPLSVLPPSRANRDFATAEDATLVRHSQAGDCAAFEQLVRRYDHALLRLALRLTGSHSDAQDLYQEAFLKAYRNLAAFRFECSFYTWIYRIATNLCLDRLRRRRVRNEVSTTAAAPGGESYDLLAYVADERPGSDPERALIGRELAHRIARALDLLAPRERVVFELRHYQGLKLRTVADILDVTEGTAKNTLFRATQKLRSALAEVR